MLSFLQIIHAKTTTAFLVLDVHVTQVHMDLSLEEQIAEVVPWAPLYFDRFPENMANTHIVCFIVCVVVVSKSAFPLAAISPGDFQDRSYAAILCLCI